jgi:phosphohistidine phosphatase
VKLYLLRHGIAEERRPGRSDAQRRLTPRGRRRMQRIARTMGVAGVRVDAIYTSPLPRAAQTAAIVAAALDAPAPVERPALAPGGSVAALLREIALQRHRPGTAVLLVGHEPDLSRLASRLVSGAPGSALRLRKGGFCRLEVPDDRLRYGRCATLEWLVAPRLLLREGGSKPE